MLFVIMKEKKRKEKKKGEFNIFLIKLLFTVTVCFILNKYSRCTLYTRKYIIKYKRRYSNSIDTYCWMYFFPRYWKYNIRKGKNKKFDFLIRILKMNTYRQFQKFIFYLLICTFSINIKIKFSIHSMIKFHLFIL